MFDRGVTFAISARDFVPHKVAKLEDNYELGGLLGKGGFGSAFVATHKASGQERTIKVLKMEADSKSKEIHMNEFNITKDLDHPQIVKMYELFEDKQNYYYVMDIYHGGELFDEIKEVEYFTEEDTATLLTHILSCVMYCHERNIVHRDLKLENILLEENMKLDNIKVIDFGLAANYRGEPLTRAVGSLHYMSPQIIERSYGPKCDVWSCGVIAFMALSGYAPFDGDSDQETMDAIKDGKFDFDEEEFDDVSDLAKDFIRLLLTYDEDKRPTAEEALQHEWIKTYQSDSVVEDNEIQTALAHLYTFRAESKLKQTSYAIIASQLLTKKEKDMLASTWRALDVNRDGGLGANEIGSAFRKYFKKVLSPEAARDMIERVDTGKKGIVEYSAFLVAAMEKKDVLTDGRLIAVFNIIDADRDGKIGVDDIIKCLGGIDSKDKETLRDYAINKVLKQVDPSGKTKGVTFSEFRKFMLSDALVSEIAPKAPVMKPKPKKLRNKIGRERSLPMSATILHGSSQSRSSLTRLSKVNLSADERTGLEELRKFMEVSLLTETDEEI